MTEGQFQGLTAIRDGWHLQAPVIDRNTGVRVTLSRRFFNNRIPIFQFGIFYDDDLEFHPGPRFDFGGRVHSNGSLFLSANTRLNFSSKVTAAKHVFTDVQKNNSPWTNWSDQVYIKNASGVYKRLSHDMGSVLQSPSNGPVVTTPDEPAAYKNANWPADEAVFQGNLLADQKPLNLPLKLNSDITGTQLDLIELVKRGKSVGDLTNAGGDGNARDIQQVAAGSGDDVVTASERYYNKTGFRVLLADARDLLPGCKTVPLANPCGIRLDGASNGQGADADADGSKGYQPRPMSDGYQATRVNGERLAAGVHKIPTPGQPVANDRDSQVWIKIETVQYNPATLVYDTNDITEDILSLGVTEQAPTGVLAAPYTTGSSGTDGRSIIKLQRFVARV